MSKMRLAGDCQGNDFGGCISADRLDGINLLFIGVTRPIETRGAEEGKHSEAVIYEEGSEGVRMMSVHRAKGLEFPIVVLADVTCKIANENPDRYVDAVRGLCAVKLAGWTPWM
jgi:hypothetical protein